MIVATAGHVDHGKTLLVKALTGVDTDRLPEEKKRGMTIDLGFAYRRIAAAESIGFIDVPGHERFIRNMLCGVAGIDFVLLVVAVDDGVMPQTREHLAILDLLGVSRGAVALTKIDRASPARVEEASGEVTAVLARTSLAKAPVLPVSAISGDGLERLQGYLDQAARDCPRRPTTGNFRMPVDRCFTIAGAGLVVTGTAVSGAVAVGDAVRCLLSGRSVKVRAIHAQNTPSATGRAGQRCALNLTGIGLKGDQIVRGDWIVAGEVPPPVRKLDARVTILTTEQRPFAHWTPVHVHLAAAETTGRVAILDGREIPPGVSAVVQFVLDRPVGACHGDRFVIRDQSAQRTVGGGTIVDVFPPARGRAKPERLAYLAATEQDDVHVAFSSLLKAAAEGLNLARFAAARNLTSNEASAIFAGAEMRTIATEGGAIGYAPRHWDRLRSRALEQIAAWHRRSPDSRGPTEDRIFARSDIRVPPEVSRAIVSDLAVARMVVKEGAHVRLAAHRPKLASADAALWKKIQPLLAGSDLRPPTVREAAAAIGEEVKALESMLIRAASHGLIVRISENRFVLPGALCRLGEIAEEVAKRGSTGLVTAGAFRDRSAIGRNLTIEVLEFFDRINFTRRIGDAHQVLRPAAEMFRDAPQRTVDGPSGKESHPGGAPGLQTR